MVAIQINEHVYELVEKAEVQELEARLREIEQRGSTLYSICTSTSKQVQEIPTRAELSEQIAAIKKDVQKKHDATNAKLDRILKFFEKLPPQG